MPLLKNPVIAFFKLVRAENLFILAFTLYAVWLNIIGPGCLKTSSMGPLFMLLTISTVLIAAAGYIINDYFDVKTDTINHPETVVIDKVIKRRWAMALHIVFSSVGFLLGAWVALKCHGLRLILFQLLAIILLWFYSTHFKKQLLVGNIVVSLLTAAIPIMPWIYHFYYARYYHQAADVSGDALVISLIFSAFAFLTSFAREIIKDMEDYKGDVQTGCRTMPIEWGMITSKVFTFFLIAITIGLLLFVELKLLHYDDKVLLMYVAALLILPLLALIWLITRAGTSRHFKVASLLLKFIMLSGIITTFFI